MRRLLLSPLFTSPSPSPLPLPSLALTLILPRFNPPSFPQIPPLGLPFILLIRRSRYSLRLIVSWDESYLFIVKFVFFCLHTLHRTAFRLILIRSFDFGFNPSNIVLIFSSCVYQFDLMLWISILVTKASLFVISLHVDHLCIGFYSSNIMLIRL